MRLIPGFGQSEVAVRPAEATDVPAISALARRTWADAFGDSVSGEEQAAELAATRSVDYFRVALERDTILVGRVGSQLVGYVQFGDVGIPEIEIRPGDQELRRVYVETELQGHGIGRELMNAALAHPRLGKATRVFLQVWEKNERAVGLYESLGFRKVGTTRFTIGAGAGAEDLVMVLDAALAPGSLAAR
jgi:ribosomal protein S18 acetylase RimI-like enzyme